MSKFFYKKIFEYKYKLFMFFKSKLRDKFAFFFKFIKMIYDPFISNLKSVLLKKSNFLKDDFLFNEEESLGFNFFSFFYEKSIFSNMYFIKKISLLFKFYDFFNFKNLKFQHLFIKNQIMFYNKFFKNNFFFSLLSNFFKQLSFLIIPNSYNKLKKKQVHVFSSFVFFDIDLLVSLIGRFRFEQFDRLWVDNLPFLHIDSSFVLEKTNRIFLLYLKMRKFLIQY